jgi:hypothetical protein
LRARCLPKVFSCFTATNHHLFALNSENIRLFEKKKPVN